MSTAKLDVWVTAVGEPCEIDNQYTWFVHVLKCDGTILEWCDRRYTNIRTKCGNVEIEVPPGCYMVVATWSPGAPATQPTSLGNHISHLQVVRVNCDDEACVTLFPPTFHWCGIWWIRALQVHMEMGEINQDAGGAAIEAVQRVLEDVPMDPLTEAMEQLARERPRKGDGEETPEKE